MQHEQMRELFEYLGMVWWVQVQKRLRESEGDAYAVAKQLRKQGVKLGTAYNLILMKPPEGTQ